eukprot:jgi/Mesen1/9046/ME000057S08468
MATLAGPCLSHLKLNIISKSLCHQRPKSLKRLKLEGTKWIPLRGLQRSAYGAASKSLSKGLRAGFTDQSELIEKEKEEALAGLNDGVGSSNEALTTGEKEPEITAVAMMRSEFSEIRIFDVPRGSSHPFAGARFLLTDGSGNLASMFYEDRVWTDSYWDEFAALPYLIPQGPIGILGLAGGTVPKLLLSLMPSLKIHGWEIDGIMIHMARRYLGLADLEQVTPEGGRLEVHVGDALEDSATVPGGFAGLVVDLFSEGKVLPQLQQADTWRALKSRLRAGGRIMLNCGGPNGNMVRRSAGGGGEEEVDEGVAAALATVHAMSDVFGGELSFRITGGTDTNYLAVTGPPPDFVTLTPSLPEPLQKGTTEWAPFWKDGTYQDKFVD